MSDRTAGRRERLASNLGNDEADALLVSSPTNVGYLTGFTGEASSLVLTRDQAILVSDGRFTTQIQQECPGIEAHIRTPGQTLVAAIAEVVGKLGVRRLAFESAVVTVADFEMLREAL